MGRLAGRMNKLCQAGRHHKIEFTVHTKAFVLRYEYAVARVLYGGTASIMYPGIRARYVGLRLSIPSTLFSPSASP